LDPPHDRYLHTFLRTDKIALKKVGGGHNQLIKPWITSWFLGAPKNSIVMNEVVAAMDLMWRTSHRYDYFWFHELNAKLIHDDPSFATMIDADTLPIADPSHCLPSYRAPLAHRPSGMGRLVLDAPMYKRCNLNATMKKFGPGGTVQLRTASVADVQLGKAALSKANGPPKFLHLMRIPKAASSTFSAFVRKQMGAACPGPDGHCCKFPGSPKGACNETRLCAAIIGCSGHTPHISQVGQQETPSVMMLRNPLTRYISAFGFPGHHTTGATFEEHLRLPEWDNVVTKMLLDRNERSIVHIDEAIFKSAVNTMKTFTFVGILEDLEASFIRYCDKIYCAHPDFRPEHERDSHGTVVPPKWDNRLKNLFEKTNKWDLQLYKVALKWVNTTLDSRPALSRNNKVTDSLAGTSHPPPS
jgi:hypothetical protein